MFRGLLLYTTGALYTPDFLLSCSMIALALHIYIILIITPKSSDTGITMAARQASRRASKKYRKQSWEERFEDDPLRSDSPTNELHAPVDKYSKTFLALSDILDAGKSSSNM